MTRHPVFVIVYNLLSTTRNIVQHILRMGGLPILIDNCSTYPPLLEWFQTVRDDRDIIYVRLPQNLGPRVVHKMIHGEQAQGEWEKIQEEYLRRTGQPSFPSRVFITDCDLDLSLIPDDGLGFLIRVHEFFHSRMYFYKKIGFGLLLDDLPDYSHLSKTIAWERQFFRQPMKLLGNTVYVNVGIDTTFHLYDPGVRGLNFFYPAVRTDKPYMARHIPWYWSADPQQLDEEARYYLQNLGHLDVVCHSRDLKLLCQL